MCVVSYIKWCIMLESQGSSLLWPAGQLTCASSQMVEPYDISNLNGIIYFTAVCEMIQILNSNSSTCTVPYLSSGEQMERVTPY